MNKVGRNEPCPCGSGKKYKKCCLAKDEAEALREEITAPAGEPRAFDDGGLLEDQEILKDYRKLQKTEEKIEFLRKLFPLHADFPTDYAIEILSPFNKTMGAEGRHAEAAEIFHLFSDGNKEIYEDACSVFDRMLVYHYIFLKDREGIQSILDRFNRSSAGNTRGDIGLSWTMRKEGWGSRLWPIPIPLSIITLSSVPGIGNRSSKRR